MISPHLLLATSFDSLTVGLEKYPDLMLHVTAIREAGAKVVFGVDATDLKKCKEVKESGVWDRVAFNFPHVGTVISLFLILDTEYELTRCGDRCWNFGSGSKRTSESNAHP